MKEAFAIAAMILGYVGYYPYLRDTYRKKTHPHIYSWIVWGIAAAIVGAIQISNGAGLGGIVTCSTAIACAAIVIMSAKNAKDHIHKVDTLCLILAGASLVLWLAADQPLISTILLISVDVFGFVPTVRKSWKNPFLETPSLYASSAIRFGLSIFALSEYSLLTFLYPVTWLIANTCFYTFIYLRRRFVLRVSGS